MIHSERLPLMGSRRLQPGGSPRRRGATIIEMMMMISILALVLGMAVIQIQFLMRLDQDGRSRLEQTIAWERLGRQLRRDVHEAASVEPFVEKQDPVLRVRGPGVPSTLVEYRVDRNDIARIVSSNGKPVVREVYPFPRMIGAWFESRTESNRRFVALVLTRATATARDAPLKVDEILAAFRPRASGDSSNPKGAER